MKTTKKIYGWIEDWMGDYFGEERTSKLVFDLDKMRIMHGAAPGKRFKELVDQGYSVKPLKAGYSDHPGETTPTYIYEFNHPTRSSELIDPLADAHNQASIINLEEGNRLYRLPQSNMVLSTVGLGHPCATGMCGPLAIWTAVHRGYGDVKELAEELAQAGPAEHMEPPYRGLPSTMITGTSTEQMEGYLSETDLSRFISFDPLYEHPTEQDLRGLYQRADGGIVKAYMQAGVNEYYGEHVYAIEGGLPVDAHRYAHISPPPAIRGIILPGSYDKALEKPPGE